MRVAAPLALAAVLLATSVLQACGRATPTRAPEGSSSPVPATAPGSSFSSPSGSGSSSAPLPAWMDAALMDVRNGATLRIADLSGKVVFLEGIATWCPPCAAQEREAALALTRLDPAKVAYVSLDIDPRESAAVMREYAQRNGFSWTFVVATPTLLRELAERFGDSVLNPPTTPIVVVALDGTAILTEPGIKSANRILELAHARGG
jgi:thiol-disulfide isomerase/thioredoxin